jgi:oxygen-dependent protoporphyrinogen oxidase
LVVVVGAGMTGLALGYALARRGADFVVLEKSSRVGGVVRSSLVDGIVLDHGPQRLRLTPRLERLVAELGLGGRMVVAPDLDLFVFVGGRLRAVPMTAGRMIGSDIVNGVAKLRLLVEPLLSGPLASESVAEFFERKLGREVYANIVGPLFGGLYGSSPADMSAALTAAPLLRDLGVRRSLLLRLLRAGKPGRVPSVSFGEGLEVLPRALAATLERRLRLDCPVHAVTRAGSKWRVAIDGESIAADAVVLTSPAPATATMLANAELGLGAVLAGLRYNPIAVAHLRSDTSLHGTGFQVGLGESATLFRGATFNHCLFGRRDLYTAYLGGSKHSEVADLGDDQIAAEAVAGFRRYTGFDAQPLSVTRTAMPAWDFYWRALQVLRLPPGLHLAGNWWSRPGVAGRLAEGSALAAKLVGSSETASSGKGARVRATRATRS